MSDGGVKIVKVGAEPSGGQRKTRARSKVPLDKKPKFGILKGGKTARKTPRFEPVRDPAKPPPHRTKSKTLRILTEKGLALRRRQIVDAAGRMPIDTIRKTLRAHGIVTKDSTPPKLVRKIYEDAKEAGMLSDA